MPCRTRCFSAILRQKTICVESQGENIFKRCLGLLDLFGLSVGIGVGCGAYTLMPYVAKTEAGPSTVLAVLIAGITALMAGTFHSEAAMRFPRVGTAYVTTYVTMGELAAFITGWSMLLDYLLLAAVAAKAWSDYFDYLLNGEVKRLLVDKMPISMGSCFTDHPDLPAFTILLVVACCAGILKKSLTVVNFVLIIIAVVVSIAIVCVGFFHVDSRNWRQSPGFFPYAFYGTLQGAANFYVAFVGYDVISSLVEETKEPTRLVPKAISMSFVLCFVTNFVLTLAVTLTYSWRDMALSVALPKAFGARGISGSDYVVGVGAFLALTASVTSVVFAMPRLSYALAKDRLIFAVFSRVSTITRLPVLATCAAGGFSGFVALFVRTPVLIEMLSIGSLLCTAIMAVNTLLLRYNPSTLGVCADYDDLTSEYRSTRFHDVTYNKSKSSDPNRNSGNDDLTGSQKHAYNASRANQFLGDQHMSHVTDSHDSRQLREISRERTAHDVPLLIDDTDQRRPYYVMVRSHGSSGSCSSLLSTTSIVTQPPCTDSYKTVKMAMTILVAGVSCLAVVIVHGGDYITNGQWWIICFLCAFVLIVVGAIIVVAKQPRNKTRLVYSAAYIPCVPMATLVLVSYMMAALPAIAWIRFAAWLGLGLLLYAIYGVRQSRETPHANMDVVLCDVYSDNEVDEEPDELLS